MNGGEPVAFAGAKRQGDERTHPEATPGRLPEGFEAVQEVEARLRALEERATGLALQDARLSNELAVLHATGNTGDAPELSALRRKVRDELQDIREAIQLLKAQLPGDAEKAGRTAAETRMIGIARAHGAVLSEYIEDAALLVEAAKQYAAMATRLNARYSRLVSLEREANALADRFGVSAPKLGAVEAPARLARVNHASRMVTEVNFPESSWRPPETEEDQYRFRRRRTYAEVSGTPAAEIITAVGGSKPFPPLTDRQKEIIAEREVEARREQDAMVSVAAEAERTLMRTGL